MTTATHDIHDLEAVELEVARYLFINPDDPYGTRDFLAHSLLINRSDLNPLEDSVIPFQKWPHIVEVALQLQKPVLMAMQGETPSLEDRFTVILKERRAGLSWIVGDYLAWRARFHKGFAALVTSIGEVQAADFLAKPKFILEHLPESWRLPKGEDSKSVYSLPAMDSSIKAFPNTSAAGLGFDGSIVVMDEADNHANLALNLMALKPIIDRGGQLVLISTIDPTQAVSSFRYIYGKAAHDGKATNGFRKFFIGFGCRPGEDAAEYERRRLGVTPAELAEQGVTLDQYMTANFPRTEAEALAPAKSGAYFDLDVLHQMDADCQTPLKRIDPDNPDAHRINYYTNWSAKGKYVAGTDVGQGKGGDYSVTVVIDFNGKPRVVADIMENDMNEEAFTALSMSLLRKYHSPMWAIEDNGTGAVVLKVARDMGYRRLYHRETNTVQGGIPHRRKDPGWHTDEKSRNLMWGALRTEIDKAGIVIPSRPGLMQFFDIMIDYGKTPPKPVARSGAHDDYPTALAIGLQMKSYAHSETISEDKIVVMPRSN